MANEKRLIWADEVERKVCKGCNIEFDDQPCEPPDCYIKKAIAECKTVDAVEVVHGRWVYEYGETTWGEVLIHERCSLCGWKSHRLESRTPVNYCPNCGAKMDGKAEV